MLVCQHSTFVLSSGLKLALSLPDGEIWRDSAQDGTHGTTAISRYAITLLDWSDAKPQRRTGKNGN